MPAGLTPMLPHCASAAAAKEPASLQRFRESEVFHGRWAMLGAAGVLGVEVLGELGEGDAGARR